MITCQQFYPVTKRNIILGITALRTVNPAQLGSVELRTIKAGCSADIVRAAKSLYGWQIKLTDGGNGRVDKYGP